MLVTRSVLLDGVYTEREGGGRGASWPCRSGAREVVQIQGRLPAGDVSIAEDPLLGEGDVVVDPQRREVAVALAGLAVDGQVDPDVPRPASPSSPISIPVPSASRYTSNSSYQPSGGGRR